MTEGLSTAKLVNPLGRRMHRPSLQELITAKPINLGEESIDA